MRTPDSASSPTMSLKSFLPFNLDVLASNSNKYLFLMPKSEFNKFLVRRVFNWLTMVLRLSLNFVLAIWEELLICFKYYWVYIVSINDGVSAINISQNGLWFHWLSKSSLPRPSFGYSSERRYCWGSCEGHLHV